MAILNESGGRFLVFTDPPPPEFHIDGCDRDCDVFSGGHFITLFREGKEESHALSLPN